MSDEDERPSSPPKGAEPAPEPRHEAIDSGGGEPNPPAPPVAEAHAEKKAEDVRAEADSGEKKDPVANDVPRPKKGRHRDGEGGSWFSRLSRANKRRVIFYPIVVASIVGGLLYCTRMPGESYHGAFAPPSDEERALANDLRHDVTALAETIGARNVETKDSLSRAEAYLQKRFRDIGYEPARLAYDVGVRSVANLEVTIPGTSREKEILIVGAHYDSAYEAPGADDNASGVAAMLAIAKALRTRHPERTIRFVAFANEEPPRFWTEQMGSLVYAKACRARNDDVVGMLSLETIGYYSSEAGSQKYPPPIGLFYGDKGDFVGFVGNTSSRSFTRNVVGAFRMAVDFPSEGAALPAFVAGVGWSDQWSFWQVGYPGVMVTDTAPFRNPHYHQLTDTADTLDYDRFARVVQGLVTVVAGIGITAPN